MRLRGAKEKRCTESTSKPAALIADSVSRDMWQLPATRGQIVASAMLPAAAARAPALRRLDSLLVAAPLWAGLVGLYITRAGA